MKRKNKLQHIISDYLSSIDSSEINPHIANPSIQSGFEPKVEPKVEPKLEPNLSQSEAKLEPKLSQSEAKLEPKLSQSEAKLEPKLEPKLSQSEAKVEPKLSQSRAKVEPIGTFESLVGLQRDALMFVFDSCLNSGSKISGAITISNLAISLRSTVAAARKAIQRLEQKGYISRSQFKDGRGGWTKYEIPQGIYSDLLSVKTRAKVEPKLSQSEAKLEPKLSQTRAKVEPQPEPNHPYNNNNINNNIIIIEPDIMLPKVLEGTGISKRNLAKLIEDNVTTLEIVNNSLQAIAYDYEHRHLKKADPARLLFQILKSGNEYVSIELERETKEEVERAIRRSEEIKTLKKQAEEEKLRTRFYEFLVENPNFQNEIRAKYNNFFPENQKLIEELLFSEFKKLEEQAPELSN